MAFLYADEDFDRRVVDRLQALGHDVLTVQDDGRRAAADETILGRAVELGRTLVTFNRSDFIRLHARRSAHCGIIVCTRDANTEALAQRIHNEVLTSGDLHHELVRVYRPG